MNVWNYIWQYLRLATVMDVIDVLLVAFLLYYFFKLIRNTSAQRLLTGILLILVITGLSELFKLHILNYILVNTVQLGFLAIVIIFQPELRKMLEQFGRSRFLSLKAKDNDVKGTDIAILQTVEMAASLSKSKTGALIVFERADSLDDIKKTGTMIDASVNAELLKNIFFNKAPLHDGAVVIAGGRIAAAGCLLPLSANLSISKELGTRHRAAVGVSEVYDCVCVVVSEETGAISFAQKGFLKRHLAPETLERLLIKELMPVETEETEKGIKALLRRFIK